MSYNHIRFQHIREILFEVIPEISKLRAKLRRQAVYFLSFFSYRSASRVHILIDPPLLVKFPRLFVVRSKYRSKLYYTIRSRLESCCFCIEKQYFYHVFCVRQQDKIRFIERQKNLLLGFLLFGDHITVYSLSRKNPSLAYLSNVLTQIPRISAVSFGVNTSPSFMFSISSALFMVCK